MCIGKCNGRDEKSLLSARKAWENTIFRREDSEEWCFKDLPNLACEGFSETAIGKRFAIMESGHTALVPSRTEIGDKVYYAFGALSPLLMRMKDPRKDYSRYERLRYR